MNAEGHNSFVFHLCYSSEVDRLSDEEAGKLIKALMAHANKEPYPGISPTVDILFRLISNRMDEDGKRYEERCKKNKKNAAKKWESERMRTQANACERMRTEANGTECTFSHCDTDTDTDTDTETDTDTDTDTESDIDTEKRVKVKIKSGENPAPPSHSKKRIPPPPTLEEVKAYIAERGSPVEPVQFFNYYAAADWKDKDGKPVLSWKQRLISWEGRSKKKEPPKVVTFMDLMKEGET